MTRIRSPRDFWAGLIFLARRWRLHSPGPAISPGRHASHGPRDVSGPGRRFVVRAWRNSRGARLGDPGRTGAAFFMPGRSASRCSRSSRSGSRCNGWGWSPRSQCWCWSAVMPLARREALENIVLAAAMVLFSVAVFVWLLGNFPCRCGRIRERAWRRSPILVSASVSRSAGRTSSTASSAASSARSLACCRGSGRSRPWQCCCPSLSGWVQLPH